jgi:formate hydrogenlyase subunit 6/NADH:ubiquinone oxidoreductase subunit I
MVRTFLTRRATVRFPFAPLDLPTCVRGKVIIRPEACTGCGLCVRDCPAFALELERESRESFCLSYYRDRCAYCGQCADNCRQGAITLVNELDRATPRRDALGQAMVQRKNDV